MKCFTLRSFALIFAVCFVGSPCPSLAADGPAAELAARQAILAHLDAIQSIMLDYDAEFTYTPVNPPAGGTITLPNGQTGFLRIKTGVETFSNRFAFLK